MQKSQVPGCLGDKILYGGTYHLWFFNTEVASCLPIGAWNFENLIFLLSLSFDTRLSIKICYANLAVDSIVITRLKRVLSSVLSLNDPIQIAENNCCPVIVMNGEGGYKSHCLF